MGRAAGLLARYAAAFERYDVDALVALLHEDATMSMPPLGWWLRGRAQIRQALLGSGLPQGLHLVPGGGQRVRRLPSTRPPVGGHLVPWALVVVEVADGWIAGWTSFLDAARLFRYLVCRLRHAVAPGDQPCPWIGLRDSDGCDLRRSTGRSMTSRRQRPTRRTHGRRAARSSHRRPSQPISPARHAARLPRPGTARWSSSPRSARPSFGGCTGWDPRRSTSSAVPWPPAAAPSPTPSAGGTVA